MRFRCASSLAVSLVLVGIAACVGDDPQTTPTDGGPAADGSVSPPTPGADGSTSDASAVDAGPPATTGTLMWGASLGGPEDDDSNQSRLGVAVDSKGNVFVAGTFEGVAQFGNGKTLTSVGNSDGYVAKYDSKGTCLAVARIGGSATFDAASAIAIDPHDSDDVIVTGSLLLATPGAPTIPWSVNAGQDHQTANGAFLVRMSNDLTNVKSAQDFLTQGSASVPKSVAVRASDGSVAVGGTTENVKQIPFGGGTVLASGDGGPALGFVAQFDAGGAFQFARVLSSLSGTAICETFIGGVAFDPQGMLVAAGVAGGFDAAQPCKYSADYANNQATPDFQQSPSTFALLLLRYDPKTGGRFATATVSSRAKLFGYPHQLAIGPKGDAYATFESSAQQPFTFGAGNVAAAKNTDGLVLHYDPNGAEAGFFSLQSAEGDYLYAVAVDPWGNVVVGGEYGGPATAGTKALPFTKPDGSAKIGNAVVLKLTPDLGTVLWASSYDGVGSTSIGAVGIGPGGVIGAHGRLEGASLSLGGGASIVSHGKSDGFTMLLSP